MEARLGLVSDVPVSFSCLVGGFHRHRHDAASNRPDGEPIRERRRALQAMPVLRQAAVAHLLESEDLLDHPDAVLDLGTHPGLKESLNNSPTIGDNWSSLPRGRYDAAVVR